jgi:hypothetical protein
MSLLTDQTQVSGVSLTDFIHVVVTGDTSQNPAGSSYKSEIQQVIVVPTNAWGLYTQTADSVTVSATTIETSIINGGIGSLSVPANSFRIGDSFNARLGGVLSSKNNDTFTIRVKEDSVTLATTGPITMPNINNKVWDLNIGFTIRNIGSAGVASILTHGIFSFVADSSNKFDAQGFNTLNNTTFDTTITTTLEITVEFSSNSNSNSITTQYFTLTKIY